MQIFLFCWLQVILEGSDGGRKMEKGEREWGIFFQGPVLSSSLISFCYLCFFTLWGGIGKPPITCHDMKDVTNSSWLLRFIFCFFFSFEMWKKKVSKKAIWAYRTHEVQTLLNISDLLSKMLTHTWLIIYVIYFPIFIKTLFVFYMYGGVAPKCMTCLWSSEDNL